MYRENIIKGKRKVEKVKNELAQVSDKKKEKKDLRNTEIVFKWDEDK